MARAFKRETRKSHDRCESDLCSCLSLLEANPITEGSFLCSDGLNDNGLTLVDARLVFLLYFRSIFSGSNA